jgi:hypothetical protein
MRVLARTSGMRRRREQGCGSDQGKGQNTHGVESSSTERPDHGPDGSEIKRARIGTRGRLAGSRRHELHTAPCHYDRRSCRVGAEFAQWLARSGDYLLLAARREGRLKALATRLFVDSGGKKTTKLIFTRHEVSERLTSRHGDR